MKSLRIIGFFFAEGAAAAAFAADPTGTWKWATHSPNGDIETSLKLESKDGKLAGQTRRFNSSSFGVLHTFFTVGRETGVLSSLFITESPDVSKTRGEVDQSLCSHALPRAKWNRQLS
jgi:hypothetical protein